MKTILVPIDFSDNAKNAVKYALNLAEKLSAKVILLHSYFTIHSNISEKPEDGISKAETMAIEDLKKFYNEFFSGYTTTIEFTSGPNIVVDEIIKQVKEKRVDLVVMATEGLENKIARLFLNTKASLIAEQASCPVIIIPFDAKESANKIKNIVYATEYTENDIVNLKQVMQLAVLFNAEIQVVRVSEYQSEEVKKLLHDFEQKVKKEISYPNLSFKLLSGEHIEQTLENYLSNNNVDLLVMSTRARDLVRKFFEKNITKELAAYIHVPLMVFQQN